MGIWGKGWKGEGKGYREGDKLKIRYCTIFIVWCCRVRQAGDEIHIFTTHSRDYNCVSDDDDCAFAKGM